MLVEGHALISSDVVASYAADAAREVAGVTGLVEGPKGGVRVTGEQETPALEVHVEVEWGSDAPQVGQAVQDRVIAYLARMADVRPSAVDVVIAGVGAPPAS